ncbi:MAG: FtsX-like permease family protein [Dysgonamonadaceae bacterium]|nr:FtsX-like permease family protein [Dysgonamonadaceae bacterium]
MSFPFYIAKRYLFSKKSHNAINIISMISVCGVAVATLSTVCILSVLNGFSDMVADMFGAFDPELKITPVHGKRFDPTVEPFLKIKSLPEINAVAESIEDNVLLNYGDRQVPAVLKGVSANYTSLTGIASILLDGNTVLTAGGSYYGLLGVNLANSLGVNAAFAHPMEVYAPRREGSISVNLANPASSYNKEYIFIGGVFQVKQMKYDGNYLIAPIEAARKLFDGRNEVSALEIQLKQGVSPSKIQAKIRNITGHDFDVKNRYEQQEESFRMINIEKWVSFLLLCFILLIATFNIIGSISMLIIDKQADVVIFRNLGMDNRSISRIFFFEGWLISALGVVVGIVVGVLLCLIQQHFGLLKLGSEGSFSIVAYPVSVSGVDLFFIALSALVTCFFSVFYPVRYLSKKWLA